MALSSIESVRYNMLGTKGKGNVFAQTWLDVVGQNYIPGKNNLLGNYFRAKQFLSESMHFWLGACDLTRASPFEGRRISFWVVCLCCYSLPCPMAADMSTR